MGKGYQSKGGVQMVVGLVSFNEKIPLTQLHFVFISKWGMSFAFTGSSCRPLTELSHNLGLMRCSQTFCYLSFCNLDFKDIVCLTCFACKYSFSEVDCSVSFCIFRSITVMALYQQRDSWCLNSILRPVPISKSSFLHSNDFYISQGLDKIFECYDEILQSRRQKSRLWN